jgi:transcriptional regulator with XRE-family HTH domain
MSSLEAARSLLAMPFPQRLVTLRKADGLTQQALADIAGLNVIQIRRWETSASQPSLEALKKLAKALRTTTDFLLFDDAERGPDDDLRLEFEAMTRLDPEERKVLKAVIDSVVLKHDVRRAGLTPAMARSA